MRLKLRLQRLQVGLHEASFEFERPTFALPQLLVVTDHPSNANDGPVDGNGGLRARNREMEEAHPRTRHCRQHRRRKISAKGSLSRYVYCARPLCTSRNAYHVDGKVMFTKA